MNEPSHAVSQPGRRDLRQARDDLRVVADQNARVRTQRVDRFDDDIADGTCQRRQGATCLTDDDCETGLACAPNLLIAGAADSDFDGLADPYDNCPESANIG